MQVGVRFYQARIYKQHNLLKCDPSIPAQNISVAVRRFIDKYKLQALVKTATSEDGAGGEKRSHRFVPSADDGNSIHGLIRYGTFGYAADVEDVHTGSVAHVRTSDQADTIMLYYRFWWPPGYSYGLWAFQSFSGRSCATAILSQFRLEYRSRFADYRFEAKKIVPNEVAQYANANVRRLTLVRKRAASQTVSSALQPSNPQSEIDIELEVRARNNNIFGKLRDMKDRLGGQMRFGDIDYSSAYATINIDGKPKKIGVIGVSTNTGVIDITDDVDFDSATNTPTLSSVSNAVKSEMTDFVKILGR